MAATEHSPERPILTIVEVFSIVDYIEARYRALVLLATFSSLRWGELAALERRFIDTETRTVRVESSAIDIAGVGFQTGDPKTKAGRRRVGYPAVIADEIQCHLKDFTASAPTALVFAGPKGGALCRANFQKHWRAALKKAGYLKSIFAICAIPAILSPRKPVRIYPILWRGWAMRVRAQLSSICTPMINVIGISRLV